MVSITKQQTLEVLKELKKEFRNKAFTTYHFIQLYKRAYPHQWKLLEDSFSLKGKGKGRYTARKVAADALSKAVTDKILRKLEGRLVAPSEWEWGNRWITQWRFIKSEEESVDFNNREEEDDSANVSEDAFEQLVAKERIRPDLAKRATQPANPGPVEKQKTVTTTYKRRAEVVAWVIENALRNNQGICECRDCKSFVSRNDEPYLEVHHVIPLSEDGPDEITNAVAVCPSCHRELHFGKDRSKLREQLYQRISRLKR